MVRFLLIGMTVVALACAASGGGLQDTKAPESSMAKGVVTPMPAESGGSAAFVSTVPEPATLVLMATGAIGMWLFGRRRK